MQVSDQSEIEKKTKDELLKGIEDKKNNTILVADDETMNRQLIQDFFNEAGFHSILLAANGQEAVDMALKHSPDLILMDIRMPVMDGYTALDRLIKKGYGGPIVMLSALTMREDNDKCLQAGAAGYITKPIDFDQFFLQIGKFLTAKAGNDKEMARGPGEQSPLKPGAVQENEYKINDGVSERVRNVFLTDAQKKLSFIMGILETGDFENKKNIVKTITHGYKGNAAFFGLSVLEASATELDQAFIDNAPVQLLINRTRELAAILKRIIEENTDSSRSVSPG
jgi:CheY-like chemotaxis protein